MSTIEYRSLHMGIVNRSDAFWKLEHVEEVLRGFVELVICRRKLDEGFEDGMRVAVTSVTPRMMHLTEEAPTLKRCAKSVKSNPVAMYRSVSTNFFAGSMESPTARAEEDRREG